MNIKKRFVDTRFPRSNSSDSSRPFRRMQALA